MYFFFLNQFNTSLLIFDLKPPAVVIVFCSNSLAMSLAFILRSPARTNPPLILALSLDLSGAHLFFHLRRLL